MLLGFEGLGVVCCSPVLWKSCLLLSSFLLPGNGPVSIKGDNWSMILGAEEDAFQTALSGEGGLGYRIANENHGRTRDSEISILTLQPLIW